METRLGLLQTSLGRQGQDRSQPVPLGSEGGRLNRFCLFAGAHGALAPGEAAAHPAAAREAWTWPANDGLQALRNTHLAEHGRVG